MAAPSTATSVLFDINVYVNALVGPDSTFPLIAEIPPSTGNASADCVSSAMDADEFQLHASPHILTNTARVLKTLGISDALAADYIEAILDIVSGSGGKVIDPPRAVFDVHDFEDNLVLDLVVAIDAPLLVSDDTDLTKLNPWNGRLILRPHEFVTRVVQSRRGR